MRKRESTSSALKEEVFQKGAQQETDSELEIDDEALSDESLD